MYEIQAGLTSQLIDIFVQDSSVTTGAGLSGLVYNSSNLACYYKRQGASSWTSVTLATMTQGTWASGGFVEGDATHAKGFYEFGIPDAAIAASAGVYWVDFSFYGATNMAQVPLRIGLIGQANTKITGNGGGQLLVSSGKVTTTYGILKNTAFNNFEFLMTLSSDHVTPATGKTVTATRSIDGAAFGACANSVSEVASGMYKINLAAADLNGNCITFQFTATGCDATLVTIVTQS